MTRTPRKQASLNVEERKLILHIEGLLLKEAKALTNPGHVIQVKFITGSFDEKIIIKVMRQYLKGGWNVYRHKESIVDRQPGQQILVVNWTILDFS